MGVRQMPGADVSGGAQFAGMGMSSGGSGGGGGGGTPQGIPKYYPEETVIGNVNNKPLYAQTFTGKTATSTVSIPLPNISYFNVVPESSYSTYDGGDHNYFFPFGFYDSYNCRYQALYKSNFQCIEINSVGAGFVGDYVLTVVYQKTTD